MPVIELWRRRGQCPAQQIVGINATSDHVAPANQGPCDVPSRSGTWIVPASAFSNGTRSVIRIRRFRLIPK